MIYQTASDKCGEACVRNMIAIIRRSPKDGCLKLQNPCHSFQEMRQSLEAYGIVVEGYFYASSAKLSKIRRPFIVKVEKNGLSHFVVVRKVIGRLFFILDPENGRKVISKLKFDLISTKYILIVSNVIKMKFPRLSFVSFKAYSALWLLSLCEAGLVLAAMAFISLENYQYVALVTLVLLLLTSYLHKCCLFSISQQIDRRVCLPYLQAGHTKERLQEISQFKTKIITSASYYASSISLGLFLAAYFMVSDLSIVLLTCLSLASSLIIAAAFARKEKSIEREIFKDEESLCRQNAFNKEAYVQASILSSNLGRLISLEQIVILFINGLLVLFQGLISKMTDPYLLISQMVFISYACYQSVLLAKSLFSPNNILQSFLDLDPSIYQTEGIYHK